MNGRNEIVCTWAGWAFVLIALIGLLLAGFIPPISPAASDADVVALYQQNTLSIRFGVLLLMTSGAFICAFAAAVATQMRRIEGETGPYTMTQLGGGCVSSLVLVFSPVFLTVAAFRPDQAPELVRLMNDVGWVLLLMTFQPFIIQNISLGLCILSDRSDAPVYPRWLGYYNLWVAVMFVPGGLLTFFKTGPFAWDGLFVWWLPLIVFFSWYIIMPFMTLSAIKKRESTGHLAAA